MMNNETISLPMIVDDGYTYRLMPNDNVIIAQGYASTMEDMAVSHGCSWLSQHVLEIVECGLYIYLLFQTISHMYI